MLKKRLLTALWGIPLIILVIWFGEPWLFTTFIAIWGMLAVIEFFRLVTSLKVAPLYAFGVVWTLLFIVVRNPHIAPYIEPHFDFSLVVPLLFTGGAVIPLFAILARKEKFNAFPAWAWTIAGIVYVGWLPNTNWCSNLVELDSSGNIKTDDRLRTSFPGAFAAGDVRSTHLRQVATAVGDGALAAMSAHDFLIGKR